MSRNFHRLTASICAFLTLAAAALVLSGLTSPANAGPVTTNLAVWLEANQGVSTDAHGVTNWANQVTGPANRGVTAATDTGGLGTQPALTPGALNGLPVVSFNGTSDYLQTAAFSSMISQAAEIFLVWDAHGIGPGGASMPYDGLSDSNRMSMDYENNSNLHANAIVMYAGGAGGNAAYASNFPSPIISDAVFNGGSSTLSENGVLQTLTPTPTNTSPAVPGSDSLDGLTLGARHSLDTLFLNGYIAEMLVYTSPLSGAQNALVENYLANKYFNTPLLTPEPSSLVLLGCACAAVLVRGRKRLAAIAAARLGR